jgi:2-succinyl-6-hydroxy-2,4-cyclohexadiene-1-carboxylate synthase
VPQGLHAERWGQGDPVVLVHGFTQSAGAWGRIGAGLGAKHRVVALDAPGHGGSSEVRADLASGADLMVEAAAEPAAWVGYSMGGRFALHVALRHPDQVRRLVLVSTSAGIEDAAERAARRRSDEALAKRVEEEGVETFVRWWLGQPLFSTLPPEAAELESRLTGTAAGLASSLRLAGAGTQEPLWGQLSNLSMPVLVVAGELDFKYVGLGEKLAAGIGPSARLEVVPGSGHACHLERPDLFESVVGPFLDGS